MLFLQLTSIYFLSMFFDLPMCWGLCAFGTPWISSLKETDFSKDTDLSRRK